jgi:hypothetical protein
MLERLVDFVWLELVADVEFHGRETNVTIRQLVVLEAETPHANRTPRSHWFVAPGPITKLREFGHACTCPSKCPWAAS